MSTPESSFRKDGAARSQSWMALVLLCFLVAVSGVFVAIAHDARLSQLLMRLDQDVNRHTKNRYSYEHYFPDFEGRLVYEEIAAASYPKGGVTLIGTSNLKWATRLWDLPSDQAQLIRNYGIGATDLHQQHQLIEYLVEHKGLLAAGGEKNLIILGTSYHATGDGSHDPNQFFKGLWERHGFYSYSPAGGIVPLAVNGFWKSVQIERVRIAGSIKAILYTLAREFGYHTRPRVHDPEAYKHERVAWLGANWKERMQVQVEAFDQMAAYLEQRGVKLVVVFLPMGTWDDALPFERAYISAMSEVCERRSIPTQDWSRFLDDDDFADSNHLNLYGVDKTNTRFLDIAFQFLRGTGALSKPDVRSN